MSDDYFYDFEVAARGYFRLLHSLSTLQTSSIDETHGDGRLFRDSGGQKNQDWIATYFNYFQMLGAGHRLRHFRKSISTDDFDTIVFVDLGRETNFYRFPALSSRSSWLQTPNRFRSISSSALATMVSGL